MRNKNIYISRTDNIELKAVLGNDNVTHAEIRSFDLLGNTLIIGRGKARWNPVDRFDPEIGKQIAIGRALEKFGRKTAAFWEKQAMSPGQWKQQIKREKELARMADLMLRVKTAQEVFQNVLEEPTGALEAEETPLEGEVTTIDSSTSPVEDLAEVENRNKAKLLGQNEK